MAKSDYNDLSNDFKEWRELMKQTTANLKRLREAQERMRWQFGDPEWFANFVEELDNTRDGWVSSNC